ncbi:hypothetical protein HGA13_24575 [Nocardia speluncae]|uniref:Uncharacterized protein n=1 Tax=Nocardia speluncae TaxID=419477 RepID=A0A846XLT8_9NOCA|nr:hypothetical protein [Nocardia speluncae]NKY36219.1 hypothetical protein [Nocardia speluncae]
MVAGESEPVLVELTVPKRVVERGLMDGLVVPVGQFTGERRLDPALPGEQIADFLADAAHRPDGFVARAQDGAQALAVLAGTVAALCGENIRKALNSPDTAFLAGLSSGAADSVREVLLGIESDTPVEIERALRAALRPEETGS